jgi:hypothetical protein
LYYFSWRCHIFFAHLAFLIMLPRVPNFTSMHFQFNVTGCTSWTYGNPVRERETQMYVSRTILISQTNTFISYMKPFSKSGEIKLKIAKTKVCTFAERDWELRHQSCYLTLRFCSPRTTLLAEIHFQFGCH